MTGLTCDFLDLNVYQILKTFVCKKDLHSFYPLILDILFT